MQVGELQLVHCHPRAVMLNEGYKSLLGKYLRT